MLRLICFVVILCSSLPVIANGQPQADVICPGTVAKPSQRLPIKTGPTGSAPYTDLTVDGKTGPWLLDYGATASSVSNHGTIAPTDPRWTSADRKKLRLTGFNMPFSGAGAREFWFYPRDFSLPGVGVQQGVVGTDILKDLIGEFHFEDAQTPHVRFSQGPCVAPTSGFWRISQEGFFGTNPKLRASHIPNVPVVFIEFQSPDNPVTHAAGALAGARTFAQLDPGFDDLIWRYSIAVNESLFTRLEKLTPKPVKVGEMPTFNCLGKKVRRPVYVLPEQQLRIEDEHGAYMTKFESFYILRYENEQPGTCNGISTMPEPAAQIGASFLRAFGTTVIVPEVKKDSGGRSIGELWIRMPQQPSLVP